MSKTRETPTTAAPDQLLDPRPDLLHVLAAIPSLMTQAAADKGCRLAGPTPCSEYTVADLIDHMLFVARRVTVVGEGRHFDEAESVELGAGDDPAALFSDATANLQKAWHDSDKLGRMYELPWGQLPGFAALVAYTSEFAVHGWDLSKAIGVDFDPGAEHLLGALEGITNIPAEGRDNVYVPFGEVTEPPADATVLERIAAWTGRDLTWAA